MIRKISIIILGFLVMLVTGATTMALAEWGEMGALEFRDVAGVREDMQAAKEEVATTTKSEPEAKSETGYITINIAEPTITNFDIRDAALENITANGTIAVAAVETTVAVTPEPEPEPEPDVPDIIGGGQDSVRPPDIVGMHVNSE